MITEISEQLGLTPRAIRFYEEKGLISTSRDRVNVRKFDREALQRLALISRLRQCGLGIPEIQALLALEPCALNEQMRAKLTGRLEELEATRSLVLETLGELQARAKRAAA